MVIIIFDLIIQHLHGPLGEFNCLWGPAKVGYINNDLTWPLFLLYASELILQWFDRWVALDGLVPLSSLSTFLFNHFH